jgi:hypothetical protein
MLHILLTILKIIGIILLVIVGLIVFLVVCILFVPIRYRANISYDGNVKKPQITAKATYLLHLISIKYCTNDEKTLTIKICGIKVHLLDKDKKEQNKKFDEDTEMFEEIASNLSEKKYDSKQIKEKNDDEKCLNEKNDDEKSTEENKDEYEPFKEKTDKNIMLNENKFFITRLIKKIKEIISKIKYRFKTFCGTIKKVCKNFNELKAFITDDNTKKAFVFVKKELLALLKHIKPRKIKGYIHYGFEDPSITGEVLGLIYMISRGTHKNFQINADFENKVMEGELYVKGYVQIYVLLIIVWKLYKNDNLKKVSERRRTYGRK